MSPPGRPKGESPSAPREASPSSPPGRPKGESPSAAREGGPLSVDGIEVVADGAGRSTIVIVHGWPDTHRLWDAQVAALRSRWRCLRFTLPGFAPGHARRAYSLDEVVAAIDAVVGQAGAPVTLLLHDWGCFFGYRFAQQRPELVERIVAVDVGDAGSRPHLRQTPLLAKAALAGYPLWLAAAWRIGGRTGDSMARLMARAAGAPADPALIGAQMGYPYFVQWTGGYRGVRGFVPACPMLFIYGRRKPFMFHSSHWAETIAARPGSRVLALDTGHWVMVEQPEAFNRALADWLEATATAA